MGKEEQKGMGLSCENPDTWCGGNTDLGDSQHPPALHRGYAESCRSRSDTGALFEHKALLV